MEKEQKRAKYANIIKKAQVYSNLSMDDNFITWKKEIVDKRLDGLVKDILSSDPENDDHKKAVIRYQELKFITVDIFKIFETTEKRAQEELKKE
jgi:hypothetical protein